MHTGTPGHDGMGPREYLLQRTPFEPQLLPKQSRISHIRVSPGVLVHLHNSTLITSHDVMQWGAWCILYVGKSLRPFLLSTLWNLAHLPVEIFNKHVILSYMCLCEYVIGLWSVSLRLLRLCIMGCREMMTLPIKVSVNEGRFTHKMSRMDLAR